MWCKLTGYTHPYSYHTITPVYDCICPPIISIGKKQSQRKKLCQEFHFSSLSLYMEEKELVLLSPVIVTLKS